MYTSCLYIVEEEEEEDVDAVEITLLIVHIFYQHKH